MGKSYVLFNQLASNGRGDMHVKDAVRELGVKAEAIDLNKIDVREFMASLGEDDKAVLCGGDGTLNYFVNDIYGIDVKCDLYLLGGGTGNDFLNDIDHKDKYKIVKINDYIKELPAVSVNGKEIRFVNGVGVGIDGAVCAAGERNKQKGKAKVNYTLLAAQMLIYKYKPCGAEVTIDGVTKRYDRIWMAPTMQGRYFGGGMMVAPIQNRASGKLTSMVIHKKNRLKTLFVFLKIFKGKHMKHTEMIDWTYADEVTVRFDRPCEMQIDGEVILGVSEYTVKSARVSNGHKEKERAAAAK